MHHQIILCFLLCFIGRLGAAADPNFISINCGGAAPATARNGRKWGEDSALKGSSTTVEGELIASVDPVPYSTARISRSQFSYTFHLTPGQKSIRLHFNPVSYHGFESFNDLFTVESGPFTLLANFSASVTARALSLNVIVKEFCIHIKENGTLNLVFYPENRRWGNNYAFINGIDIISLPSMIAGTGVPVLGHESVVYVDNSTALERIHYQHIKWGSFSSSDDIAGMFGMWAESSLKKQAKLANPKTWRVSVDVGFMYLVRLHLCEVELEADFVLLINNIVSFTSVDMLRQKGSRNFFWYNNYMVMNMEELKEEDDHDILISLHSHHEFLDRHGPLEGFEVFKLSNHDRTLASPRLLFPSQTLQTLLHSLQALLYKFHGRISLLECATILLNMCIVVIAVSLERKMPEDNSYEKDNKPLAWKKRPCCRFSPDEFQAAMENFIDRFDKVYQGSMDNGREIVAIKRIKPDPKQEENEVWTEIEAVCELQALEKRLCRRFSLAEIQAATENFHPRFVLGNDGFGKVYRGSMDNGREVVAIKRLKPDSKQDEHEFWTEIKTLSELQHVNLISLIGYCREQKEMILVYEYIAGGTLADHIYELAKKNNDFYPLSWKQRLKICIGVGRALDYLHMGHRIIYRDLKASNILLDETFVPEVKDFSLVKIGSGGESLSQDSKKFRGTFGYVDATYFRTPKLTEKSNIYSFGVLLLEVLCGRPAPPWNEQDKGSLITWKGQVDQLVAPSLRGEISPDSLKTYMKVAEGVLHDEPKKRPNMADIVTTLELALLQQEKGESVAQNERIRVEDAFSCRDISREENMNFNEPNDKINVDNDVSPGLTKLVERNPISSDMCDAKFHCPVAIAFSEIVQAVEELLSGSSVGRFSHLKPSGYCQEDEERALVYEMMAKGRIRNHLFLRGSPFRPLHWDIRLKIVNEISAGLALLHASNTRVIHGDLKPSNILLDISFNAKLSDFGLGRLGQWVCDAILESTGDLHFKSDGHSIGWLIPDKLIGVRALDHHRPPGQHDPFEWRLKPYLYKRKVKFIDDLERKGTYPSISALLLALLDFNCLESEPEPKNRPSMHEMVDTLDGIASSNERPRVYFGD